jgi:hypothetical protein
VTGSDRRPASNGEKPSTFWKKSVMYRNIEKIDADSAKPTIVAPVKAGLRNSDRSSSGSAARRSTLVEAGDPEAIDVYRCEQDAQRALEDCLRDEPEWRGLLEVTEVELDHDHTSLN